MTSATLVLCAASLLTLPAPRRRLESLRVERRNLALNSRTRVVLMSIGVMASVTASAAFGGVHLTLAAAIVAATLWNRRRARRRREQHRTESESLITGLETIVGELRVGAHPASACETAAADCAGSVAIAFESASARARLGGTAHEGLRITDSPVTVEMGVVADAWRVADEHGLALVGLLAAVRSDMLARNRFRDRTQASLAGARATGTVLAGLPLVGVALGQAMGASPIEVLLGGGLGGILLVVGSGLVCAGLMWTDAITEKVCR